MKSVDDLIIIKHSLAHSNDAIWRGVGGMID